MSARLESALHNPVQEQEVRAAVESVFPFSSLAQFLTLPSAEKQLQLNELPCIVAGICLFNKSTGVSEAGACVAALHEHATDPTDTLKECLEQLQHVRHNLLCYSSMSQRCWPAFNFSDIFRIETRLFRRPPRSVMFQTASFVYHLTVDVPVLLLAFWCHKMILLHHVAIGGREEYR